MAKPFEQTFPTTPGVYRIFNASGELIYVGKAKNLRRRLGQYRNAKRRKRHAKMRSIVKEAGRIEIDLHPTDFEACIAETALIQTLRPKWNVAGAFYFLYPVMGLSLQDSELHFLYSTEPDTLSPELLARFSFHGAYRSRFLCGNAFFGLMELLKYVGHANKTTKPNRHSYHYSYRQLSEEWLKAFDELFSGRSNAAFEKLVMALVESSSARRQPKEIQKHLNALKLFFRHEAQLLRRVCHRVPGAQYPVPQKERDVLFLKHRYRNEASTILRQNSRTERETR